MSTGPIWTIQMHNNDDHDHQVAAGHCLPCLCCCSCWRREALLATGPCDLRLLSHMSRGVVARNTCATAAGEWLVAGRNQYRSIWCRDFAYSVTGLLELGEEEKIALVGRQCAMLVRLRLRGLVPKGVDTMSLERRVVIASVKGAFGFDRQTPFYDADFQVLHEDFLGSVPIDSNMLILHAAIQHAMSPGSRQNLLIEHFDEMKEVFDHYKSCTRDGLIWQPPFSDWQDSTKRLLKYHSYGITEEFLGGLKEKINSTFFDERAGLFRSIKDREFYCADGNLFAIDWGFVDSETSKRIYQSLRQSQLWNTRAGCPGLATFPKYPLSEKAPQIRLTNMHGYHDDHIWTWLAAFSAKIAYKMNDIGEGDRIATLLAHLVERDSTIYEIYTQDPSLRPVNTCTYHSEMDFTWAAGKYIEMLRERERKVGQQLI